jgi:integrase/recombinase XerD
MLGHRDLRSTQIYAKITNDKINEDMKALEARMENKYQLAK